MKQEQMNPSASAPSARVGGARARRLGRGAGNSLPAPRRADVNAVAPKLTKLVTTKIITPRPPSTDPRVLDRGRLLASFLAAHGRPSIVRAFETLHAAGHELPEMQEVHLQLLEHGDEGRVRASIETLSRILAGEPARHRPVLEQRLKRLEEGAEEPSTRAAAAALRRTLR